MENNKPGNYLKYALGEIVLVVLGILIALSINNWNENRNHESTVKSIYSIIKTDLLSDIENIDNIFDEMSPLDTLFKRAFNNQFTYEDYNNCYNCRNLLMGFPDLPLKKRGINLLEKNSTIFDSSLDSLSIQIIDFYSYNHNEIEIATKEIMADYFDSYFYFKNNKPWFTDWTRDVKNDDFITYALTSSDYKNRVSSFYTSYYDIYLYHLELYKKNAFLILNGIDKKLE